MSKPTRSRRSRVNLYDLVTDRMREAGHSEAECEDPALRFAFTVKRACSTSTREIRARQVAGQEREESQP